LQSDKVKELHFKPLFKEILPEEITDNVFTLVGKVFPVVTVGNEDSYNSMTASGGGMCLLFRKPSTMLIFPSNRYTLELIEKEQTYTLSYFPDEYKKQVMFLGSNTGRDSAKMNEVELTGMCLPSGNMSFKEAKQIIECKLTQITVPCYPDDLYSQEAKDFMSEAYRDPGEHRKYVFGEITHVWER
jgi:flavin reductase (DIM6/NTAB) family NADH-FMN oxidoreductase RutF